MITSLCSGNVATRKYNSLTLFRDLVCSHIWNFRYITRPLAMGDVGITSSDT